MHRRFFMQSASTGLFSIFARKGVVAQEASELPNIIFVLADDLGYGDVQCLNEKSKIPTPNFNQIAKEGITFTDAHSGSAVCTPTRYGLLTGRYCWRSRLKSGVLDGYGASLIEPNRETVASLLKKVGYHTSCVGKWHLGLDFAWLDQEQQLIDTAKPIQNSPNAFGFDYFYGIPASLDFPPYGMIENDRFVKPLSETQEALNFPEFLRKGPKGEGFNFSKALDDLTEKATSIIHEQAQQANPFFLYFALTAPHKPVMPEDRFKGKTTLGAYGDFVTQVDWTVGQIREAVEKAGIKENTLLIVTSDNGSFMYRLDEGANDHVTDATIQGYDSANHQSNFIYRGTKADIWEAGHRVPFIAQYPKKVKPGTTWDYPICLTDFFATCAELSGQSVPDNAGEDSFSFAPILINNRSKTMRPPVVHHSVNGTFAVRSNDHKLVLSNGSGGREQPAGKPFEKPYQLFNLSNDPSEQNNLAETSNLDEQLESYLQFMIDAGQSVPPKQW